jgi:hypothetical protein
LISPVISSAIMLTAFSKTAQQAPAFVGGLATSILSTFFSTNLISYPIGGFAGLATAWYGGSHFFKGPFTKLKNHISNEIDQALTYASKYPIPAIIASGVLSSCLSVAGFYYFLPNQYQPPATVHMGIGCIGGLAIPELLKWWKQSREQDMLNFLENYLPKKDATPAPVVLELENPQAPPFPAPLFPMNFS